MNIASIKLKNYFTPSHCLFMVSYAGSLILDVIRWDRICNLKNYWPFKFNQDKLTKKWPNTKLSFYSLRFIYMFEFFKNSLRMKKFQFKLMGRLRGIAALAEPAQTISSYSHRWWRLKQYFKTNVNKVIQAWSPWR